MTRAEWPPLPGEGALERSGAEGAAESFSCPEPARPESPTISPGRTSRSTSRNVCHMADLTRSSGIAGPFAVGDGGCRRPRRPSRHHARQRLLGSRPSSHAPAVTEDGDPVGDREDFLQAVRHEEDGQPREHNSPRIGRAGRPRPGRVRPWARRGRARGPAARGPWQSRPAALADRQAGDRCRGSRSKWRSASQLTARRSRARRSIQGPILGSCPRREVLGDAQRFDEVQFLVDDADALASAAAGSPNRTSLPPISILRVRPEDACQIWISVLFPAPFSPQRAWTSPPWSSRSTAVKTVAGGKSLGDPAGLHEASESGSGRADGISFAGVGCRPLRSRILTSDRGRRRGGLAWGTSVFRLV